MDVWDPTAFKALLRTTSQRLGQLQERKDSQGQLTRREIATCLSKGHLAFARAKAAALVQEDVTGDLLEELEMHVGVVGSHIRELGGAAGLGLGKHANRKNDGVLGEGEERAGSGARMGGLARSLSPVLIEAVASIIHAAPSTESKDLNTVREILIQRLGTEFSRTASTIRNNHVSPRIMQILSSPPPTASKMDAYLANIAETYAVKWVPRPRREDLLDVISEILRVDAGSSPIVDLPRLREMCARGLPDEPPWVRPRTWRLLLGTLPNLKTTWARESQKQRDSYYDLVHRLLTPLASLPSPASTLSLTDTLLARISDSLFRVSPELFVFLGNEPKSTLSSRCSLVPTAPDNISCASNLDKRLSLLKGESDACETPEIRLDSGPNNSGPESPPLSAMTTTLASRRQRQPTTLLPSKAYNAPPAHRAHISALLRLLYIHSTLNPAVQSPHIPWLLVPLYSALIRETNEDDAAHAEADTFWVFEALVGEIAEMEEEEGGKAWMQKLSERVRWADGDLASRLHATGLDPILPHYSYRWLAPLLSQTLPLSSVFPIWDVLFACPIRTRNANPKLEYLVDICAALLVRARTPLFRLGKPGRNVPGLWTQEHASLPPPSPLRPWELSDAFSEGIALLTSYPIDAAGGIDRVLQTASDFAQKRIEEGDRERGNQRGSVRFGARITQRMWMGFTNQVADESPEEEGTENGKEGDETEERDDGNETETPAAPTLTSRFANTVWRGITNQSSMDDETPSPPSPLSARRSPTPEEHAIETSTSSSQAAGLWGYAGKLKDSDTMAAISKASTNWRAKALEAWGVRKGSNTSLSSEPVAPAQLMPPSATNEIATQRSGWLGLGDRDAPGHRRGSLRGTHRESEDTNLDPPRPVFFRSPRESFLPQPRRQYATAPSSPNVEPRPIRDSDGELSASSFIRRTSVSLAPLQLPHLTPRSVPRPLMLSSRDLITTKSSESQSHSPSRSEGRVPERRGGANQWGDMLLFAKTRPALRQESVSSASSLSPSEATHRPPYPFSSARVRNAGTGPRSDHESDGSAAGVTSRRVPLNRKSISPMALASRSPNLPWNTSFLSGGPGSGHHPLSNGSLTAEAMEVVSATTSAASGRGWRYFDSEEQVHPSAPMMASMGAGTTSTTGFDSPATIASPPIPPTPLMTPIPGPGIVRIVNGGRSGIADGGVRHVAMSSISTLNEAGEVVNPATSLEPRAATQSRLCVRKKTPPLPGPADRERLPSSESGDSELSLERTPSGVKLRSKRYVVRSGNLRVRTAGTAAAVSCDPRTPSPGQHRRFAPEWPGDSDLATTPRVESHSAEAGEGEMVGVEHVATAVAPSRPPYVRKPSKEARLRKVSSAGIRDTRRAMNSSGAEEGDDEGYGDLLSAYESEEGSRE